MANLETYLQAFLDKLEDGTETTLPDPSWNHEKYLAAIYELLSEGGSGGSGGSGGGVLVVTDTDGTLDKTWQEIHDAMLSGGAVLSAENEATAIIEAGLHKGSYEVYVGSLDSSPYSADSASGYPVFIE